MRFRTFVWTLGVIAATCFVVVLYPIYRELSSDDAVGGLSSWAHAGAFAGGMLGPVLGLLNLAVALYIANSISDWRQRDLAVKRLSMDLFNEWHDRDMHASRIAFSRVIAAANLSSAVLPTLSELEGGVASEDICRDAFRIYHFFEKWAVMSRANQLDRDLMISFLGSYAEWWQRIYFNQIRSREHDIYMSSVLELLEQEIFVKLPKDARLGVRR